MSDLAAPFYTLVMESTHPSLAEFEKVHQKAKQYSPEEIETDISQAIKEVREA